MPAAALERLAGRLSTRSLQIIRNCLERAICHAEIRDLVAVQVGHRKASVSNSPPAWDTIPGPSADTVIFGRRAVFCMRTVPLEPVRTGLSTSPILPVQGHLSYLPHPVMTSPSRKPEVRVGA